MQARAEDGRVRDIELIGQYLIEGLNRADALRLQSMQSRVSTYRNIMKTAMVRGYAPVSSRFSTCVLLVHCAVV